MWKLDCEESWAPKNWCFWTVVLEKILESPLDCKEIQPVHPKGDQSWVFFGRTDATAETPILWPPHVKSWLIGKDSDAGRDWGQEEKGTTEDEKAGWHHWLYGHEFVWTLRVGDGQGGLVCCDSWGRKESDMTERLNWTELIQYSSLCYTLGPRCFIHSKCNSLQLPTPRASLVAQMVKNLPAMRETWVPSLGWEDLWRWGSKAPTPVFLPGESLWTEEPGGLQSLGVTKSQTWLSN